MARMLASFAALMAAVAVASAALAPLYEHGEVIPNEYLVVFSKEATEELRRAHFAHLNTRLASASFQVMSEFNINNDFTGYAATLDTEALHVVRRMPLVAYVERNQVFRVTDCTLQEGATWGLVRVSERALKIRGDYKYDLDAANVDAYVIDTGIYVQHSEFEGRASWGTDTIDRPPREVDGHGHGTHVAGTVGGKVYGVAKQVKLIAVKVLNAGGSGTTQSVVAGINWAVQHHQRKGEDRPSVANMSLGGGRSAALDNAVNSGVGAGIVFVVAAGNSNGNACNFSPAAAARAVTTGATDNTDGRASYSNFGTCTKIFAPGTAVTSAWIGSPTAINTISGTSMASPHVCGVAALFMGANPAASPDDALAYLRNMATKNVVRNPGTGSPNLLVYTSCAE